MLALRAIPTILLCGSALAQSPELVLRVGDAVSGAGHVTDIRSVEVHPDGHWMALVHTDDPVVHTVLYSFGGPYLKVGDSPPNLGGASFAELSIPTWDVFGTPTFVARLSGSPARQALMFDVWLQLLTGDPATNYIAQLPSGSTWRRFDDVDFAWINPDYLIRGSIDDGIGGQHDRGFAAVAWQAGSYGVLGGIDLVALVGDPAPGLPRAIERIASGPGKASLDRSGTVVLWSCDLDGSSADDGCVYCTRLLLGHPTRLLAREGSPSPVPGRVWGALEDIGLDIDLDGSWTLRGQLDASDPASDEVLVHDGAVLAREGDSLPAIAPYALVSLGDGRGDLDDNGRVLWYGRWDDPTTPGQDEALFQQDLPLVRTGVSAAAGSILVDIESGPTSYAADPSHGRYVAFVGSLADGTRGLFVLDQGGMQTYCTAKTNSLNFVPALEWSGQPPSASAGSGFEITAQWLLAHAPALFFYGTQGPAATPFHGGFLCVSPPLHHGPLMDTGGTSHASGIVTFDFNAWIASGQDPTLVAGQSVFLQVWYRDRGFPAPDDIGLTAGLTFQIGP